jgi:ribosomal protein S30
MLDKLIKKLEKAGKIRKQKVGFVQPQNPQLDLKFQLNEK